MRNFNHKDLSFFDGEAVKGDIIFSVTQEGEVDLSLTGNYETADQDLKNRLLTQLTDWRSHPNIGANLETFIGQHNTREVGQEIKEAVAQSLMYDGRFSPSDVNVHVIPVSHDSLQLIVHHESNDYPDIIINEIIKL